MTDQERFELKGETSVDVISHISTFDEEEYKREYRYEPRSKWKELLLNVPGHKLNETLFDHEPYNIDTILTFEDHLRVDRESLPLWKRVIGFFWDPIFLPPSERRYMIKADIFIFIYAILACFIKYLDQTNINNAYVSGMKEDLNMYGANDYNLLTTYFNIGYLAFSVPMSILMKYVRLSVLLPACEVIWTFLVMIMAVSKNKQTIFGLRLLQGVIEASSFPGLTFLVGEYYDKESMGKRMFMLDATGAVSRMFAGYIQAGVYSTMNGRYGLPGWKWVFLVDGFISIPVALLGFYCLPDFPTNSRASWMSKKDRQFALARYKRSGKKKPTPMTLKRLFKTAYSWKLWLFVITYVSGVVGGSTNYFPLYLKSLKRYTVEQINLIPTAGQGWQFVSMLFLSAGSDYFKNRIIFISIAEFIGWFGTLLLVIWHIPFGLKIFAFILSHGYLGAQTLTMSWFAEVFHDEPDLKAINIGLGNTLVYSFNAFLPLRIFKQSNGPRYYLGYRVSLALFSVGFAMPWVFWYVTREYTKRREAKKSLDRGNIDREEISEVKITVESKS